MRYYSFAKSTAALNAAIRYLMDDTGYKYDGHPAISNLQKLQEAYRSYMDFPYIVIYPNTKTIQLKNASPSNTVLLTFEELFIKRFVADEKTVKLNAEYNAIVTQNEIKVGCQTFPISVLDDLIKARNEVNNS